MECFLDIETNLLSLACRKVVGKRNFGPKVYKDKSTTMYMQNMDVADVELPKVSKDNRTQFGWMTDDNLKDFQIS